MYRSGLVDMLVKKIEMIHVLFELISHPSVCRFKSQLYLAPSSGISIVWRADSWRRRHAPPQLSALQTMEMPLDGGKYGWLLNLQTLTFPTSWGLQHNNHIHSAGSDGLKCCAALATLTEPTSLVHWYYRFKSLLDSPISTTDQGPKWLGNREINQSTWEKIRARH